MKHPGVPVVGMIGGGQLARMSYQAGIALGIDFRLLAEAPDTSAAKVVGDVTVGDYRDFGTVLGFAQACDVVTFDHEHVPPSVLRKLDSDGIVLRPGPEALLYAQDKGAMRERLTALGVACPRYRVVDNRAGLATAAAEIGGRTLVLKTTRGGYDGKGVWVADARAAGPTADTAMVSDDVAEPFAAGVPVLVEEHVDFRRELAAVVARSPSGQAVAYPVVHSIQRDGICHEVITPAPDLAEEQAAAAQRIALTIARELDVTGILAVELFETRDGRILVNELAMRPHNSGHWSIDGAVTGQFENHLRAVLDLPLGSPKPREPWTVMVNVLGGDYPDMHHAFLHCMARDPGLRIHLYGKEVRPGRKIGHVTACGDDLESVRERAQHAAAYLTGDIDE